MGDIAYHGRLNFAQAQPEGKIRRRLFPQAQSVVNALVSLAKVHRIELGPPDSFDRPATTAEALDRLEQRAGPQARAMLEQFLEQVKEVEAKYLEGESAD